MNEKTNFLLKDIVCEAPHIRGNTIFKMKNHKSDMFHSHFADEIHAQAFRQQYKILVSEDNDMMRQFLDCALKRLGYKTVAVDSAAAALEIVGKGDKIALHIADVYLPGMDGRSLHRRILECSPGTKCLLISGSSREQVERSGGIPEWADFMPKPFSIWNLAERLHEMLELREDMRSKN